MENDERSSHGNHEHNRRHCQTRRQQHYWNSKGIPRKRYRYRYRCPTCFMHCATRNALARHLVQQHVCNRMHQLQYAEVLRRESSVSESNSRSDTSSSNVVVPRSDSELTYPLKEVKIEVTPVDHVHEKANLPTNANTEKIKPYKCYFCNGRYPLENALRFHALHTCSVTRGIKAAEISIRKSLKDNIHPDSTKTSIVECKREVKVEETESHNNSDSVTCSSVGSIHAKKPELIESTIKVEQIKPEPEEYILPDLIDDARLYEIANCNFNPILPSLPQPLMTLSAENNNVVNVSNNHQISEKITRTSVQFVDEPCHGLLNTLTASKDRRHAQCSICSKVYPRRHLKQHMTRMHFIPLPNPRPALRKT